MIKERHFIGQHDSASRACSDSKKEEINININGMSLDDFIKAHPEYVVEGEGVFVQHIVDGKIVRQEFKKK